MNNRDYNVPSLPVAKSLPNLFPDTPTDWLARLVAFDSTSSQSNLPLVNDVAAYLAQLGVDYQLIYNKTGDKANLWATIATRNSNAKKGGIILSAHSDVVPTVGQAWASDPYVLKIDDGNFDESPRKLFGRGACDMKGFLACMLTFVPRAIALAKMGALRAPLHLSISYDEEVGCLGVRDLLEFIAQNGYQPRACWVGEPTNLACVVAHKSITVCRAQFFGRAAHSSTLGGINAIDCAADFVVHLRQLIIDERALNEMQDNNFDVPQNTLSVGLINGGTASNIVADCCAVDFEYRLLPQYDPGAFFAKIGAFTECLPEGARFDLQQIVSVPAFGGANRQSSGQLALSRQADSAAWANEVAVAVASSASLMQQTEQQSSQKVSYATEAGLFAARGIATVVCGAGNIQQAHKPNEWVFEWELLAILAAFEQLVLSGGSDGEIVASAEP